MERHSPGWAAGALGGLVASIPMGLLMLVLYRWLLRPSEKVPLPPEQITTRVAARAGLQKVVQSKGRRRALTWAAHLGYGALAGALYPLTAGRLPVGWLARGWLFALLVWAGSYFGWLPAARILPPASEYPARRNILMVVAHLLWGSIIAFLAEKTEGFNGSARI